MILPISSVEKRESQRRSGPEEIAESAVLRMMALPRALVLLALIALAGCASPGSEAARVSDLVAGDGGSGGGPLVVSRDRQPGDALPRRLTPAAAKASPAQPSQPVVPVLLFHGVCAGGCTPDDTYGITRADLAAFLTWLGENAYTTIDSAAYARALRSDRTGLPARPVLLTFDDGRSDAYAGADGLLLAARAVATMFVITGRPDGLAPGFMSWADIADARASGRWDIQLHAANGHTQVVVGNADGGPVNAPFFANRMFDTHVYPLADAYLEPRGLWQTRVREDLARGIDALRTHLGTFEPTAFAVPYGDYGQAQSNDPSLAGELRGLFDATFPVWFTQSLTVAAKPQSAHEQLRYYVLRTTTPADIEAWLLAMAHLSAPAP
jgi:peptidoglycan/xylan/chitin deacetylase (PgdA/CDA1 family)